MRFGSREKAYLAQFEVGAGAYRAVVRTTGYLPWWDVREHLRSLLGQRFRPTRQTGMAGRTGRFPTPNSMVLWMIWLAESPPSRSPPALNAFDANKQTDVTLMPFDGVLGFIER
jgi:hypothetical protein